MRPGIIHALLLTLAFASGAEAQRPQAIPIPDPFQISVDVNLVVLNAVVRDRKGQFVTGLRESDFAISEDGVKQAIKLFRHEDVPVTVGLVVDHSGSMRPKLSHVVAAARTFVESSRPEDQMFVINFNENVMPGVAGVSPTGAGADALAHAISSVPATGKTALYDAALAAFGQAKASGPDKKVIVVISDGGDNASAHTLAEVLKTAGQSSAIVYTIGIFDDDDPDQNPGVLRRIARATGGQAFFPRKLDEVVTTCASIARDIRNQYTIGYASSNPAAAGAWRSIRLTAAAVGHGKLQVRTRAGYMAANASR